MLDVISLMIGLSALAVSILSHVKHSKCCNCELETRDKNSPTEKKPILNK